MKDKLTEKEQETFRASKLLDAKTSEIIDLLHTEEDDKVLECLYEEIDKRYPDTVINYLREQFEEFLTETEKRLEKVEERLSRIDNHYLIINKLDRIMKILQSK